MLLVVVTSLAKRWSIVAGICIGVGRKLRAMDDDCVVKAKFHYTDPTGPARTLSATRTDPTEFRRKKSPCGSVRVRSGPCRARVVEFSYYGPFLSVGSAD